jgi:membrane associated rhomboid family serine protease
MIPLRDSNPRSTTPVFTVGIILANLAVFIYQLSLSPHAEQRFMMALGMVPARLQLALTSPSVSLGDALFPLFSSMFVHGGWLHLIGNMWFLWVFGDNIEDRLGHFRFLLFYLAAGIGSGLIHTFFNWSSTLPAVGASGAISGVLGAYFVLFPRTRVLTLVPLLFFFFTVRLPAAVVLGFWFVLQFLSGLTALGSRSAGGVAWWAHIGGFVLGVLLVRIMSPRRSAYYRPV